ncbi:ubiquitin carboxyl-terminal hydrolase 33 [Planoprotostelium fungivorum]|uniref:Ubiquitin carboxyl-terminal hydrolase n=1 Tax=Planoprotostelium fungivorum TaxID=1890364 RepID=A0A2P6NT20_9EUKA|nr:ubiquitin carboxyl-terminal hydrolase 33 [Planoprotostelium fungivorum]
MVYTKIFTGCSSTMTHYNESIGISNSFGSTHHRKCLMSVEGNTLCIHWAQLSRSFLESSKFRKIVESNTSRCAGCNITSSLWLCLKEECFYIGCEQTHAQRHFSEAQHPVCMQLKEPLIWCHICERELEADTVEYPEKETDDTPPAPQTVRSFISPSKEYGGIHPGLCGLQNLGNTCYMNSALQALSNSQPLSRLFLENSFNSLRPSGPHRKLTPPEPLLSESYSNLVRLLWTSTLRSVPPAEFLRAVTKINPFFRGYQQQDSQELLRFALDRMHEELSVTVETTEGRESKSVIRDIFGGQLLSTVKCLQCEKVSYKEDSFYDISVSIPSDAMLERLQKDIPEISLNQTGFFSTITGFLGLTRRTLELRDCLHAFCAREYLYGSNQYNCEHCKAKTDGEKMFKILKLPEILCIHVKRFRYDSYFSSKLSDHVRFPLRNLSMETFCCSEQERKGFEAFREEEIRKETAKKAEKGGIEVDQSQVKIVREDPRSSGFTYDLIALINHTGGLGGGHYVSYCKGEEEWNLYDDSRVSSASESQVENTEGYILFYRRQFTQARSDEVDKTQDFMTSQSGSVDRSYYVPRIWWTKFRTMNYPGPIDNTPFTCPHGSIKPQVKMGKGGVTQQMMKVPPKIWDYLRTTYGGGPEIQSLSQCMDCDREMMEQETQRRKDRKAVSEDRSYLLPKEYWHLISTLWVEKWRTFINGSNERPGEIDNLVLLERDGETPREGLKSERDYIGVTPDIWKYLQSTYGGGPEIVRKRLSIYSHKKDKGLE